MTLPAAAVVSLVFMCLALVVGLALLILCTNDEARAKVRKTFSGYSLCPKRMPSLDDVSTHYHSSRRRHSDVRLSTRSSESAAKTNSRTTSMTSYKPIYDRSQRLSSHHEPVSIVTSSRKYQHLKAARSRTDSDESNSSFPQPTNSSVEDATVPKTSSGLPLKGILRNATRKTSLTSGYDTNSSTGATTDVRKSQNRKSVHLETTAQVHA